MTLEESQAESAARIAGLQAQLVANDVAAVVIGPSPDLFYFTGLDWDLTQRLVLFLVGADGSASLILPSFDRERATSVPDSVELVGWLDGTDPIDQALARLPSPDAGGFAAAPELPARILLELGHRAKVATWSDAAPLIAPLRLIKSAGEIERLREAANCADSCVDTLVGAGIAGLTEHEASRRLEQLLSTHDMRPGTVSTAVARGASAADPFHRSENAVIGDGDVVMIDVIGRIGGYLADITRTVHVGEPGDDVVAAYGAVIDAQAAAFDLIAPGVSGAEVDRAVRQVFDDAGLSQYLRHRAGHGIGLELHEGPNLDAASVDQLRPGMTFTVQPAVYVPGRFGVRVEDVGAVTETGSVRLSAGPSQLRIVT